MKAKTILPVTIALLALLLGGVKSDLAQTPAYSYYYLPLIANILPPVPVRLGPFLGGVLDVAADPNTPGVLYVATWDNGLFKSLDHGQSWFPISAGLTNLQIQTIAVDRLNPGTLYAGTYYSYTPGSYSGVFKTTDGGLTWAPTGTMTNYYNGAPVSRPVVYSLAVDPTNGAILYAGTRMKELVPGNLNILGGGGVFKSTDAGLSWQPVNTGLPAGDLYVYDVTVDPFAPGYVYAAMHQSGLYATSNGGATWSAPGGLNSPDYSGRSVLIDAKNDSMLIFGAGKGAGVFRSADGGATWSYKGLSGLQVGGLAQNPLFPGFVFASAQNLYTGAAPGLYRSTDRGGSYSPSSLGHSISQIAADPFDGVSVYAGAINEGVLISHDNGVTWSLSASGLSGYPVTALAVGPSNPNLLYAALSPWGVMKSTDRGVTWAIASAGLPSGATLQALVMDPTNSSILYAATYDSGVYVSTNAAASWTSLSAGYPASASPQLAAQAAAPGLPPVLQNLPHPSLDQRDQDASLALSFTTSLPTTALAVSPFSPGTVLAGTAGKGVLRWANGAWNATSLASGTVDALLFASTGKVFACAASSAGSLWVSADGGQTWAPSNSGLAGRTVLSLSQSPLQPALLYAGTDSGLFRSLDGGATWSLAGLAGQAVSAVRADPQNAGWVQAGTPAALYESSDRGLSWSVIDSSVRNYGILSILTDPSSPKNIFLATRFGGAVLMKGY